MKNFFDTKNEKITEKAFTHSLVISVISILMCLVALCSMTYAWFTEEMTSTENRITSGSFDFDATVEKLENGIATAEEITVQESEDGVLTCTLALPGEYRFTLTRTAGSTANGYCFVRVGDGAKQPTATIAEGEGDGDTNPFYFTVTTTEADTVVEMTPSWGIHATPLITHKGVAPVIESNE